MNSLRREILAALIQGPGFGLEIYERLGERQAKVPPSVGALYPALRALEKDGLLTSFAGETTPARGGRPRIYYELTGEGRRVALGEPETQVAWGTVPGVVPT